MTVTLNINAVSRRTKFAKDCLVGEYIAPLGSDVWLSVVSMEPGKKGGWAPIVRFHDRDLDNLIGPVKISGTKRVAFDPNSLPPISE